MRTPIKLSQETIDSHPIGVRRTVVWLNEKGFMTLPFSVLSITIDTPSDLDGYDRHRSAMWHIEDTIEDLCDDIKGQSGTDLMRTTARPDWPNISVTYTVGGGAMAALRNIDDAFMRFGDDAT